MRGLEPPRCHHHRLLRPARLPVPPHPRTESDLTNASVGCQATLGLTISTSLLASSILLRAIRRSFRSMSPSPSRSTRSLVRPAGHRDQYRRHRPGRHACDLSPVVTINVAIAVTVDAGAPPPVVTINVAVAVAVYTITATEPPVVAIDVTIAIPVNAITAIAAASPIIIVIVKVSVPPPNLRTSRAAAVANGRHARRDSSRICRICSSCPVRDLGPAQTRISAARAARSASVTSS